MNSYIRVIIFALFMILVLSGCSLKSEENAIMDAKEAAKQAFEDESPIEANDEVNGQALYLPANVKVQSGDATNLILEDGDQTFIVFHNINEDSMSELNYHSTQTEKALALESFKDEESFGYIRILEDEGEGYELQVGVGGVKITTYTTKGNLDKDALEMMKMAKFISTER
ncbi:hypothetical protein CV093_13530 [Oceanobacillus sp. 143]|uniref:Lipoprotein n=1 Tax=Oceanobacillus zhaokaii TaxID=2052660 RepID=A0A345PIB0_9BACI|nr:hypothetical protein [Oceanobacillus zhaokaii]AXI09740.1 hypothetical protein CUC15_12745 [Oceanobacillus zhaokaii]QGS69046.1 hypothetical protein CV093_13530 [Oceanobacillus sp. 143]